MVYSFRGIVVDVDLLKRVLFSMVSVLVGVLVRVLEIEVGENGELGIFDNKIKLDTVECFTYPKVADVVESVVFTELPKEIVLEVAALVMVESTLLVTTSAVDSGSVVVNVEF